MNGQLIDLLMFLIWSNFWEHLSEHWYNSPMNISFCSFIFALCSPFHGTCRPHSGHDSWLRHSSDFVVSLLCTAIVWADSVSLFGMFRASFSWSIFLWLFRSSAVYGGIILNVSSHVLMNKLCCLFCVSFYEQVLWVFPWTFWTTLGWTIFDNCLILQQFMGVLFWTFRAMFSWLYFVVSFL